MEHLTAHVERPQLPQKEQSALSFLIHSPLLYCPILPIGLLEVIVTIPPVYGRGMCAVLWLISQVHCRTDCIPASVIDFIQTFYFD